MLSFECDYNVGAHPKILEAFIKTNLEKAPGYGKDPYTESAARKICEACGKEVDVRFLVGGTQTNRIVIDSMLGKHEGVLAATTGHVNLHEAGAIEASGHKVLVLPGHDGKLAAEDVETYVRNFYADQSYDHMVFPGMVYISHPTEYGTLYTKAELEALSKTCRQLGLPLFLDGARLGYGLMSYQTDVTLKDIVELCDVFYIGGTKVGALCGEAVVFTRDNAPKHFFTLIKQNGALVAKGRLLGVQFDALFTDDLYFKIGRHAIDAAEKLKEIFQAKGYRFFIQSSTNQQFFIMDDRKIEQLRSQVRFEIWEKYDETHSVVRFVTSWATTEEELETLSNLL